MKHTNYIIDWQQLAIIIIIIKWYGTKWIKSNYSYYSRHNSRFVCVRTIVTSGQLKSLMWRDPIKQTNPTKLGEGGGFDVVKCELDCNCTYLGVSQSISRGHPIVSSLDRGTVLHQIDLTKWLVYYTSLKLNAINKCETCTQLPYSH